jgi:hypothetical protein
MILRRSTIADAVRRLTVVALLAGVALLAATPSARAQGAPPPKPKPFRLQFNFIFPTYGDTKDILGSTIYGGGFSFDLPNKASQATAKAGLPTPLATSIYFEGTGSSRTKNNLHLNAAYYGLGVGLRYYPTAKQVVEAAQAGDRDAALQLAKKPLFYLGGGLGGYYQEFRLYDQFLNTYVENNGYTVKFGGKVVLGVDIGQLLFVEGNYTWPGNSDLNSWGLSLGVRL